MTRDGDEFGARNVQVNVADDQVGQNYNPCLQRTGRYSWSVVFDTTPKEFTR